MKSGIREKMLLAGLVGTLNIGCEPSPVEEYSIKGEYDKAVAACMAKFPSMLTPEERKERRTALEKSFIREKTEGNPWPEGKIPYLFGVDMPPEGREKIQAGMKEWEVRTGKILFIPRTDQADRIFFSDTGKVCSSELGKRGGQQQVNLANPACFNDPGLVLHELGHAIGLIHEHQRPGWENSVVVTDYVNQGIDWNYGSQMGLGTKNPYPYDFNSVMGYNSYELILEGGTFRQSENPSLLRRDDCGIFETAEHSISPGDVERVKMLYQ